jgi:LysM repeat protein
MIISADQGSLKKLSINTCSVDAQSGKISLNQGADNLFKVMINPKGYEHNYSISYSKAAAMGSTGSDQKFNSTNPDKINFEIWIDGSGVVRDYSTMLNLGGILPPATVQLQLKKLNKVVYNYDGVDHEPNVVRLLWGSMIFYGRLESMAVSYKLFKPNGEPLRAMVKLAFSGFVSKEEESLKAKRSSPDLTHVVEVKSGDTLPLLCNRIYKDCSYYLAVAEVNGIDHFRDIKTGQKLYFPPLS